MKAKQVQAQYETQNSKPVRQNRKHRRILAGFAAAAALAVGGAVTVGAANGWNYGAVFNKYFTEKSGKDVSFDYSGMGLNVGDSVTGEGFSLTVQSVMADTGNVYIAYDIALDDEIKAQIQPGGNETISLMLSPAIMENETKLNSWCCEMPALLGKDGIWHGITFIEMPDGTDLNGKQLQIRHTADRFLIIGYDFDSEGVGSQIQLNAPDFNLSYDLSGITVQPGMTVPYGGTLPDDANKNTFNTVTVTPFMLRFESKGTVGSMNSAPKWGMVFGSGRTAVSITAVYEDGTVLALNEISDGGNASSQTYCNPDGSYGWEIVKRYCFDTPFSMDGLTAIRINDNEIPMK